MSKYRVVSYNVQSWNVSEERKRALVENIKKLNPDLVGLQEVTYEWDSFLNENLGENYYIFGDFRFTNFHEWNEKNSILISKKLFDVIDYKTFWLSETPNVESIAKDCKYPRLCTYAIVEIKSSGKRFAFLNTHLDHISEDGRENEARYLAKFIKTINLPIILTGDFNSMQSQKSYNLINKILDDSKLCFDNPDLSWTWHSYNEPIVEEIIDYIFVNKFIKPLNYFVDKSLYRNKDISDHRAIALDFDFNN